MTDRLSAIGGQLVIDTAPGRGTRIIAAVDTPVEPSWPYHGGVHTTTNRVAHTVVRAVPPQKDRTTPSKVIV